MKPVKMALEFCLEIFCSWTLAYELCLLLGAPAILILVPFILFICPMLLISLRHWKAAADEPTDRSVLSALLLIALAVGSFTLVARRPDPDDFMYFHRALGSVVALDKPILTEDPPLDAAGITIGTVLHHMTSYEMFAAMMAKLFWLDPLWFYQNAMPFVAAAMVPFVYYFLYREFDVGKTASILATTLALVFLFIDGNTHRSFGNFAFVRLWQGKSIVITLLLPATFLLARAFLMRPGKMAFFRLAMVGVSGVGFSEVGVYLIPVMVLALSLAYLVVERFTIASLTKASRLWASMFFPLLVGAGLLTGLAPKPRSTDIFVLAFPAIWWRNLQLVVNSGYTVVRDLLILFLVPVLALKRRSSRWFTISLCAVLLLLFANPLMGKLWIHFIFPASYWRLVYLLPLPWLFGLLAPALAVAVRQTRPLVGLARIALVMSIVASVSMAFESSVIYAVNSSPNFELVRLIDFKSPLEDQLPRAELDFARAARADLHGKDVLGPDAINYVIGLLDPAVSFAVTRADYTFFGFKNIGQPEEGQARLVAQLLVSSCSDSGDGGAALKHCIANGVNAIVAVDCNDRPDPMPGILAGEGAGSWKEIRRADGYVLYLKTS
jgi:hypothetical protein